MAATEEEKAILDGVQKKLLQKCFRHKQIYEANVYGSSRFHIDIDTVEARERRTAFVQSVSTTSSSVAACNVPLGTSSKEFSKRNVGIGTARHHGSALGLSIEDAERRLQNMLDLQEVARNTKPLRPKRLIIKRSPQKKKELEISTPMSEQSQPKANLLSSNSPALPKSRRLKRLILKRSPQKKPNVTTETFETIKDDSSSEVLELIGSP